MYKKISCLLLAVLLVFSCAACGKQKDSTEETTVETVTTEVETETQTEAPTTEAPTTAKPTEASSKPKNQGNQGDTKKPAKKPSKSTKPKTPSNQPSQKPAKPVPPKNPQNNKKPEIGTWGCTLIYAADDVLEEIDEIDVRQLCDINVNVFYTFKENGTVKLSTELQNGHEIYKSCYNLLLKSREEQKGGPLDDAEKQDVDAIAQSLSTDLANYFNDTDTVKYSGNTIFYPNGKETFKVSGNTMTVSSNINGVTVSLDMSRIS